MVLILTIRTLDRKRNALNTQYLNGKQKTKIKTEVSEANGGGKTIRKLQNALVFGCNASNSRYLFQSSSL